MSEIYVVASGKGGVGKSSLTVLLGRALTQMGKKILLIDSDIGLRSLDIILGVQERVIFTWGDVLSDICDAEQAIIKQDGLSLLAAPMTVTEDFTIEKVSAFFESFKNDYDYIFIDAGAGISGNISLAMCAATNALIISTPDNVCVRSVSFAANMFFDAGFEPDNVRLIVNKFDRKATGLRKLLNVDDVIDSTGVRLIGVVPNDRRIEFCCPKGQSLPKDSDSVKAIERIARRVDGENIRLKI